MVQTRIALSLDNDTELQLKLSFMYSSDFSPSATALPIYICTFHSMHFFHLTTAFHSLLHLKTGLSSCLHQTRAMISSVFLSSAKFYLHVCVHACGSFYRAKWFNKAAGAHIFTDKQNWVEYCGMRKPEIWDIPLSNRDCLVWSFCVKSIKQSISFWSQIFYLRSNCFSFRAVALYQRMRIPPSWRHENMSLDNCEIVSGCKLDEKKKMLTQPFPQGKFWVSKLLEKFYGNAFWPMSSNLKLLNFFSWS